MKTSYLKLLLLAVTLFPSNLFANDLEQAKFNARMDKFLEDDLNVQKIGMALEKLIEKRKREFIERQAKLEYDELEKQFENPIVVEVGSSPFRGPENAAVTIVEFSDFQCPFCRRGAAIMEELLKSYPKQLKLVYMNFPLQGNPESRPAALAASAANKQGKFWQMHDLLFKNQDSLNTALYGELAVQLDLNIEQFRKDIEDPLLQKLINDQYQQAIELGLNATPGYFVNGVFVSGAKTPVFFRELIDRWLQRGR